MSIVVPKATRKAKKMIKALTEKFGEGSSSTLVKGTPVITEEQSEAQEAAITLSTKLPRGKVLKRKKHDTSKVSPTPSVKRPNTRSSAVSLSKKPKNVVVPKVTKTYKKSTRRLILTKESSDTESEDKNKLQIVKSKKVDVHSVDNFCANLKQFGGFGAFRYVKYESRSDDEKRQIEEAIICTLLKFRLVPLEVSKSLPNELYLHIDNRWKYAMDLEKQMRERSLVHLFPDMSIDEIKEHLKNC